MVFETIACCLLGYRGIPIQNTIAARGDRLGRR
jgi:hypothetical protein